VKFPLAVASPGVAAPTLANTASQLDRAGADGLVLFNRFYQPDIDIRTMRVSPRLELSHECRARFSFALDRDSAWPPPAIAGTLRLRCNAH